MKRFNDFLLTGLAILWLCISAQAQSQQQDADSRAAKLTELMTSTLALTPEQVPLVQEINLRYAHKVDDLRLSTSTKQEKMNQFKTLADQKEAELKGIFTEDQYKSYLVKKKEFEKRMKERLKEKQKAGTSY